jgi:2-polyprenyl-3-methyl-5-hydroxy-6-metoxy-1,4-benzoquinol methylase
MPGTNHSKITGEALSETSGESAPVDVTTASSHDGRLRKVDGIDYKRGAIEYTHKLGPAHYHYHYTKPFYNVAEKTPERLLEGLGADAHRYFCDFANMAMMLRLEAGRRILEVGCGPGWLCEYFARLGYDVTGTDISPDLISVARERIARLGFGVDHETPVRCRFEVHDIERALLADADGNAEIFDAIICYDALHHFENEEAVMRHFNTMLPQGGLLFVLEGERPLPGSAGERKLIEVMRDYGTLESPFTREYLLELLAAHDFHVVGDFVSVNGLFEREIIEDGKLSVAPPALNYLLCKKLARARDGASMPDSRAPGTLRAVIELDGEWQDTFAPGATASIALKLTNTGDTLWLVSSRLREGIISFGIKLFDEAGAIVDERHNEPLIPSALAPDETATVALNYVAPRAPGRYTLKIDLIDQQICWFEERGSPPLVLPFVVS